MTVVAEPVTVVIPVFNRAQLLPEAIDSVLAQSWPDVSIVIVDDGSTDGGADAVERRAYDNVRVVRQDNAGPSAARNRGLAAVRTRLVTFLDSDDLMVPDRIETQAEHLASDPSIDAVIGLEQIEVAAGVTPPRWVRGLPPVEVFPRYYNMSVLLDRAWLDRVGGFDESVHIGEDIDLMVRLRAAGAHVATLDRVVVIRRVNGDNLIYREDEVDGSMLQALHRHLANNRSPHAEGDGTDRA
jgi:glycosyltransferase involved in cell wall biosynthesis